MLRENQQMLINYAGSFSKGLNLKLKLIYESG